MVGDLTFLSLGCEFYIRYRLAIVRPPLQSLPLRPTNFLRWKRTGLDFRGGREGEEMS